MRTLSVPSTAELQSPQRVWFAVLARAAGGFNPAQRLPDGAGFVVGSPDVFRGTYDMRSVAVTRIRMAPALLAAFASADAALSNALLHDPAFAYAHPRVARVLAYALSDGGSAGDDTSRGACAGAAAAIDMGTTAGNDGGATTLCLVASEFFEGGTLAAWLAKSDGSPPQRGPLSAAARVDIALGIASGLAFLHRIDSLHGCVEGTRTIICPITCLCQNLYVALKVASSKTYKY